MAVERQSSDDFDLGGAVVKHQHSFSSDTSTCLSRVPMWDSSDPDRAPPPLPLNPNPGSPNLARPNNTSAMVAAAAQALADKARENMSPSPYITNKSPEKSPERSLVKNAAHKRMQSLQPSSVSDLKSYLDNNRSPDRSPERSVVGGAERPYSRAGTPATAVDLDSNNFFFSSSPDKSASRNGTPTPSHRESRATSRPPPKAILGENTPPSAAMLALRDMAAKDFSSKDFDTPLLNLNTGAVPRPTTGFEPVSSQILNLTSICTNLQREMSQLSRRSKDNATDLVSLKEATNLRDEDIRKSLKDLVELVNKNKANALATNLAAPKPAPTPRSGSASSFIHQTAQQTPPTKSFSLPRIPSPGLNIDDVLGSPSAFGIEGPASVAMLEKIIREMVTKEGQDRLLSSLTNMMNKASEESVETKQKVAELVDFIKEGQNQALVSRSASDPPPFQRTQSEMPSGALMRTTRDLQFAGLGGMPSSSGNSYSNAKSAELPDEVVKLLQKIKDSIAQTGGMVGEVKAQQRDLRGEVMGMGRELARKIDEFHKPATGAKAIEDGSGKQDVARIVQEGLAEIKLHLDTVMREKRRQSTSSVLSRTTVDSREVYDVVKHELSRRGFDQMVPQDQPAQPLDKDAILGAVKEAYENYRPEIDIQQFGLERDEILQCMKEGFEDYRNAAPTHTGISREEVLECIQEAMQSFQPPAPVNDSHEIREEVLAAVKECLNEIRPSLAVDRPSSSHRDLDVTRDVVVEAVRSALLTHGPNAPRELEINPDDLFEAMKAAMESSGSPFGKYGEEVVSSLHNMMQEMHSEFKEYSTAGGRDTEQVLDAFKDGFDALRRDMETHDDRAHALTKDEIVEAMRDESQRLNEAISSAIDKAAVLTALHTGFESLKAEVATRGLEPGEVDEAMKVEFDGLRDAVIKDTALQRDEVMDMMQTGLDSIHQKLDDSPATSTEQIAQIIREELEPIRDSLASTLVRSGGGADDVADIMRENLTDMKDHHARTSKEHLTAMQEEFEHLRNTLSTSLVSSGGSAEDKDEIIEAVHTAIDGLRTHMTESMSSQLVTARPSDDNEEVMEALREAVASIEQAASNGGMNEGLLQAIRGEFEVLRTNFSRLSSKADSEETLEAVRLGLDDLRSHIEKKIDNPERQTQATGEILDGLNEGLEELKVDIQKIVNKPVDMTVSYEILDTLKQGLDNLREDIAKLRKSDGEEQEDLSRSVMTGNEIVLAEDPTTAEVAARKAYAGASGESGELSEALKRNSLEKMEVMIAQLQIKIDTMDENIQNPVFPHQSASAPGSPVQKADLSGMEDIMRSELASVEDILKDLQATVTIMAAKELDNDLIAKKEDTDAIETLLRNTKDAIDELKLPSDTGAGQKEQLDAVQSLLQNTREAVDDLTSKVDDHTTATGAKTDVLEVLMHDLKTAVDDLAIAQKGPAIDEGDQITKKDLDVLGVICLEVKDKIAEMRMPDTEQMPSKSDMEQLTGLLHDFRESHDKMKDSYETDISITARAFDDRKKEAEDTLAAIDLIRSQLSDVHDELKAKVDVGVIETSTLRDDFKTLETTIGSNFNVMGDIKELMEIVNREFERVHGTVEDMKTTHEQRATTTNEKHDEVKAAVIAETHAKLEEKFDAIMSKYDDAQIAAEAQVAAMEERASQQADILATTKEVAEDLKISLDTLGTTVTAMETTFTDISDKISGDSQTVFNKIDEGFAKVEDVETRAAAREEHEQTRTELARTLTTLQEMQNESTEFNPKFMVTLQEVLALVNQHYEHSQSAQEVAQEQARAATEQTRALTEEFKTSLPTLLPALLPAPAEPEERYDDTQIHSKLDTLLDHTTSTKDSIVQLDRLDKIHQQVIATAAEVSEFVNSQTRLITEGHESKEKECEEMALLLERRMAEKEHIDNDLQYLRSEKESLMAVIETLRSEKEALVAHKAKLAAEVSSLNTAVHVRKEELHAMDAKADALERRILEGIMNQSRALVMTKNVAKGPNPATAARTASNVSHSTVGALQAPSVASQGLSMALKQRPSPLRRNGLTPPANAAGRRILSLNQISGNTPTGARAFYAPSNLSTTQSSLARSQSVRNQGGARKISWSADTKDHDKSRSLVSGFSGYSEDKENEHRDDISDDGSYDQGRSSLGYDDSETGTVDHHRRGSSIDGDSESGSGSYASYAESTSTRRRSGNTGGRQSLSTVPESDVSGTASYASGEEGSYLTGDEEENGDRRESYASSTVLSKVGGKLGHEDDDEAVSEDGESTPRHGATSHIGEEEGDVIAGAEEMNLAVQDYSHPGLKSMVRYAAPSDSGLGSDLPTAAMGGSEVEYFRRNRGEFSEL